MSNLVAFTLLVVTLVQQATAAGAVSCHIHPPGSPPESPRGTIGPFDSVAACEVERAQRFGATGRCHCAADFAPRWLPPPADPSPAASPLG